MAANDTVYYNLCTKLCKILISPEISCILTGHLYSVTFKLNNFSMISKLIHGSSKVKDRAWNILIVIPNFENSKS